MPDPDPIPPADAPPRRRKKKVRVRLDDAADKGFLGRVGKWAKNPEVWLWVIFIGLAAVIGLAVLYRAVRRVPNMPE
jgi:hypothetical protein